jgi:hypothetical protein
MASNNYDGEYLSKSGLSTLWNKIKSVFLTKDDAGTLTEILDVFDYFYTNGDTWTCTVVPPLVDLISTQHKNVVFNETNWRQFQLESSGFDFTENAYIYKFSTPMETFIQNYGDMVLTWILTIMIPDSSNVQPSDVTVQLDYIPNARLDHSHGNISSGGCSTVYPNDTDKFLRADGNWVAPDNIERSVFLDSNFRGVKFCTTRVTAAYSTAYGVFSFSISKSSPGNEPGSNKLITGTIQLFQRTNANNETNVITGRITVDQEDTLPGLHLKYILRDGDTVDWYLDSFSYIPDGRIGFHLTHKWNNSSSSVTPLDPVIVDTSNISDATYGLYKTPGILHTLSDRGNIGRPVYISGGRLAQCAMLNGSPSMIKSLYSNDLSTDTTGLYFCAQRSNSALGGWLSQAQARKAVHGSSIGGEDTSNHTTTPVFVKANGSFSTSSNTLGSRYQHIYLKNGVLKESELYIRPVTVNSAGITVDLTGSSYSSGLDSGSIIVVGNCSSGSITVKFSTESDISSQTVTIPTLRCRLFVKESYSEPNWRPDY